MSTAVATRKNDFPAHPFALKGPGLDASAYADLRRSIREHGLLHPVVLFDGQVIDGVHRQRACREIGVECRYVELEPGQDPETYSRMANYARRHVSPLDRAKQLLDAWIDSGRVVVKHGKVAIPLENSAGGASLALDIAAESGVSERTAKRAISAAKTKADARLREREAKKAKVAADREAKAKERETARAAKAKEIADRDAKKAAEREAKKAEKEAARGKATADDRYIAWCKEMIRHLSAAGRTLDALRELSGATRLADDLRRSLAAAGDLANVRHGSLADPDVRLESRSLNALMSAVREYRPIGHLDGELVARGIKNQRTKESLAALVPLAGVEEE